MQEQAWKVGRGQGTCAACGRGFEAGEDCLAALTEAPAGVAPPAELAVPSNPGSDSPDEEAGNWLRYDYCKSCWSERYAPDQGAGRDSPSGWLAYWRTSWEPPSAARRPFNRQTAIDVFRRTGVDAPDDQRLRLRYVLALMLMRKRVLKFADTERGDGGRLMLRESDGTVHQVEVPPIATGDADALSEEIARIMGW